MTGESDTTQGASVRIPPPVVPVLALAAGVALNWIWPFGMGFLRGIGRSGLASALILVGLGVMLMAIRLFRASGQDPAPWKSSPEVISTGIYRYTRNPMYLGMGLLQAGIGVALANGWIVLLVPPVWVIIYFIAIRHEEAYLEEKFGSGYTEYKRSVRRWL